jgi:chromosome segregation ATPase
MAEIEVGGIKFRGGKIVLVLTALSTAGGALWGGFEFWKDYEDMKSQIASYTAPDLSGFDRRLAVQNETVEAVHKEMASVRLRVAEIQQLARDLREDVRSETAKVYDGISAVDSRSRSADGDTRAAMRQAEKTLRDITASASERFDSKINGVDAKLDALEARLNKTLQRALDNPLLKGN